MSSCDLLIRNARIIDGDSRDSLTDGDSRHKFDDGSGSEPDPKILSDLAVRDGHILRIAPRLDLDASTILDAAGLTLTPGFIDTHTHDDTSVILTPSMLPKLSQGVTTVITGNCGISAAPVTLSGAPPDPMNLLGPADAFRYPTWSSYITAIQQARPAVNVAALVGHTALRNNHMDRLDRAATASEVAAMRVQLDDAITHGALGLSTGLAYLSANSSSIEEVLTLAEVLGSHNALYTTHLRSETAAILEALQEAFTIGRQARVPVIVSHLKCAGIDNWGRSEEVLATLDAARKHQPIACDCYPYAAGSSTLDLRQVDERVDITITWSDPHPEMAGNSLAHIAAAWNLTHLDAARRLQPAGAIYHSISEQDMRRILQHPATMIGSDGLPHDPLPHPRLWGSFPRVLGKYTREEKLFSLPEAIHKMTGLPSKQFQLQKRGLVREGYAADLVLFDPAAIHDTATFANPISAAEGIHAVWVNGILSYQNGAHTARAGKYLHSKKTRLQYQ